MVNITILDVEWDSWNRQKCQKHGLSCDRIEAVFKTPNLLIAPDVKHSGGESRYIAIGAEEGVRPVFVVFTLRENKGVQLIRPISARYMHEKELKRYGQNFATDSF